MERISEAYKDEPTASQKNAVFDAMLDYFGGEMPAGFEHGGADREFASVDGDYGLADEYSIRIRTPDGIPGGAYFFSFAKSQPGVVNALASAGYSEEDIDERSFSRVYEGDGYAELYLSVPRALAGGSFSASSPSELAKVLEREFGIRRLRDGFRGWVFPDGTPVSVPEGGNHKSLARWIADHVDYGGMRIPSTKGDGSPFVEGEIGGIRVNLAGEDYVRLGEREPTREQYDALGRVFGTGRGISIHFPYGDAGEGHSTAVKSDPSKGAEYYLRLIRRFYSSGEYPRDYESLSGKGLKEAKSLGGGVFATESPYEVKSVLNSAAEETKVLYDPKKRLYLYGKAEDYIHNEMLEKAWEAGYYPKLQRWELPEYEEEDGSRALVYLWFIPGGDDGGRTIGVDGYTEEWVYPNGVLCARSYYSETPLYDQSFELPRVLGKPKSMYVVGDWNTMEPRRIDPPRLGESASVEVDDHGRPLSQGQAAFFRDSKIRDRHGRLLTCYHSTRRDFDEFDPKKASSNGELWGRGFYFSTTDDQVYSYGDKYVEAYLNVENPWVIGASEGEIAALLRKYLGDGFDADLLSRSYAMGYGDIYAVENCASYGREYTPFREVLERCGYDGIIVGDPNDLGHSEDEIVVFRPNQIKRTSNANPSSSNRMGESYLTEKTRQQLLDKSRNGAAYAPNNRSKGRNRYERRKYSKVAATIKDYNSIDMNAFFKGDYLEFGVPVHGETDDYVVTVTFERILPRLQQEVKSDKNRLSEKAVLRALLGAFNTGDVYVSCTCADFTYAGFNYLAVKQDYNSNPIFGKAMQPPTIKNPNDDKGAACKHILRVLSDVSWMMNVARVIYNYIKVSRELMQRNYAEIIFPKVYGRPYKGVVQMSLMDKDDMWGDALLQSDRRELDAVIAAAKQGRDVRGRFSQGNPYAFRKRDAQAGPTLSKGGHEDADDSGQPSDMHA